MFLAHYFLPEKLKLQQVPKDSGELFLQQQNTFSLTKIKRHCLERSVKIISVFQKRKSE